MQLSKQGKSSTCRECNKSYIVDRTKGHRGDICNSCVNKGKIARFKLQIEDYAGNVCVKCGYNKCSNVIEYHHVANKEYEISKLISRAGIRKIKAELDKCIPLCANCHREFHYGYFKYSDIPNTYLREYQKILLSNIV